MSDDSVFYVLEKGMKLTLGIPEPHVWNFMKQFGDKFADRDPVVDRKIFKQVDSYTEGNPHFGWIIKVSIDENREDEFSEFLGKFLETINIKLRGKSMIED